MLSFIRKHFGEEINWVVEMIGKIKWKQNRPLSEADKQLIMEKLKNDYYIIATRRGQYFSTYAIAIANFFLTGKFSYYSHVLMNLEDEANNPEDFRLIEATGKGVQFSNFDHVFGDVDAVCLLRPTNITLEEWTLAFDKAKMQNGKPYDTLFDLANEQSLSCVELIRVALRAIPGYDEDFSKFERMITTRKNLTPQMFRDCEDFKVDTEIKK